MQASNRLQVMHPGRATVPGARSSGRCATTAGRWGLALSWVCATLLWGCLTTSRPTAPSPFELGRDAAEAGEYLTAISQLTVAIQNSSGVFFTDAYLERGECYRKLGDGTVDKATRQARWDLALEDFDLVLEQEELEPAEEARALSNRGEILHAADDPAATAAFQRVLELPLEPSEDHYRLEAHRHLGWIYLEEARKSVHDAATAERELAIQEKFRLAQEEFSRGLKIDPQDPDMNLGKGICLHRRGQSREAIVFLTRSTRLSETAGDRNPRGHYQLALALETQKGLQLAALEHYRLAVQQDPGHELTSLYAHLVEVIPVYMTFDDPRFEWFFDQMLSCASESPSYWASVEELAGQLKESAESEASETLPEEPEGHPRSMTRRELGIFGRAIARARNDKIDGIDGAVEDAQRLQERSDYLERLSRVFPDEPPRPRYLYGKALALLKAGRYEELEALFDRSVFRFPGPALEADPYFQKAKALQGLSILESWGDRNEDAEAISTPQAKLMRDKTLGQARDLLQDYLEKDRDDLRIRLALGEVQELMEAFPPAFLSYAVVAEASSKSGGSRDENEKALLGILRLHSGKLLPQKDLANAWRLLRDYGGKNTVIREYVRNRRREIAEEVALYCRGCGRKAVEGETICPECGRQLGGSVSTRDDLPGNQGD